MGTDRVWVPASGLNSQTRALRRRVGVATCGSIENRRRGPSDRWVSECFHVGPSGRSDVDMAGAPGRPWASPYPPQI